MGHSSQEMLGLLKFKDIPVHRTGDLLFTTMTQAFNIQLTPGEEIPRTSSSS